MTRRYIEGCAFYGGVTCKPALRSARTPHIVANVYVMALQRRQSTSLYALRRLRNNSDE